MAIRYVVAEADAEGIHAIDARSLQGVRVNSVAPGLIRTPLAEELLGNEGFMARRLASTPLRRVGEPDEIAGVVVILASRAGGFITGQNLVVDGGTTMSDGN
ncbi:SDR family oxidoreductase [Variovorax robiniae]|uniref:SDR family oxidoreductase n=1 Tax=Variovorax robiniae TaxID=1836199 RepID=A0ABU8X096_9BURK